MKENTIKWATALVVAALSFALSKELGINIETMEAGATKDAAFGLIGAIGTGVGAWLGIRLNKILENLGKE